MATSYTNPGGSGNRSVSTILVTFIGTYSFAGGSGLVVDGATASNAFFFTGGSTNIIEFWFASKKIIDEAKWYQSTASAHGTWKWQGSNDRTTWTDIGGIFTLGGVTTQTITTLAGNVTGYVFYRLFQVTGPASGSPWIYEIEFKIDEAGGASYVHALGSGNRTATITTAIGGGLAWTIGSGANLVNGSFGNDVYWNAGAAAGGWVSFDLGAPYIMQGARYYVGPSGSADEGSWKFQGSTDNSAWVDLSGTVVLTANSVNYFSGFSANTTLYRYYRMLGVSGNRTTSPYQLEIEFMVDSPATISTVRVTQDVVEILSLPFPALRVTQDVIEILSSTSVVVPTDAETVRFYVTMP